MIIPVTYPGKLNFKSNLYAVEIKSRFIDQAHADGYYVGYGSELEAKIVGNQIQIGTGAFVVQGRMNEVISAETVTPQIYNNFVGYVVARIETFHPSDDNNCTFKAYVNTALSEIPLRQDNVYAINSNNENLVYELPIYSFEIKNGAITNLVKLIKAVDDYARIQQQVQTIQETITDALNAVNSAKEETLAIANDAKTNAETAITTANAANNKSTNAETKATNAMTIAQKSEIKVNDLEDKVIAGGTVITVAGTPQSGLVFESDPQEQLNDLKTNIEELGGNNASGKVEGFKQILISNQLYSLYSSDSDAKPSASDNHYRINVDYSFQSTIPDNATYFDMLVEEMRININGTYYIGSKGVICGNSNNNQCSNIVLKGNDAGTTANTYIIANCFTMNMTSKYSIPYLCVQFLDCEGNVIPITAGLYFSMKYFIRIKV